MTLLGALGRARAGAAGLGFALGIQAEGSWFKLQNLQLHMGPHETQKAPGFDGTFFLLIRTSLGSNTLPFYGFYPIIKGS